jgi:caudovirus prohead protease|nr:MAG TPA: major capsid protein [Caudoviricetes sp.]
MKLYMDRKKQSEKSKAYNGVKFQRELPISSIKELKTKEGSRKVEISFSSEEPYSRWYNATEILDHTGVDLTRLNDIGVVLFNHNRNEVIGKITRAWIEDSRGCAEIEFDDDEKSELIFKKVQSGTLKGVSVGYIVNSWEEVIAGKKSGDGRFEGPCYIARNWIPYEVSIVSIPADPGVGVGREIENTTRGINTVNRLLIFENQIQINKNKYR